MTQEKIAALTTPTDRNASLADELARLMTAATPGDLSTAEIGPCFQEDVECPCCSGEGSLPAVDYTNIDGVALGVQFFGIGNEQVAHEKLWTALVKNLPAIISALRSTPVVSVEPGEVEIDALVQDVEDSLRLNQAPHRHGVYHHEWPKLRLAIASLAALGRDAFGAWWKRPDVKAVRAELKPWNAAFEAELKKTEAQT